MYFDTHAHYDDERFDADRDAVLRAAYESGVGLIMNNASDYESCVASLALAETYPFVYASVGWHPHEARFFTEESEKQLRGWCENPRVRAIGEIGLDYYYDHSERDVQRAVFARQLALARELDMPVVVHDRDAHADCLEIIRRFPGVRGEFHCYSGSVELAREILDLGWYLGFGGAITFKNARKALEVLEICPNDRILIETDCPYLAPVPHRGERNDSRLLPFVAEKIGEIKGLSPEAVAELTFENGKRFFGLG